MRPVHAAQKRLAYGRRSSDWPRVRKAHLSRQPDCQACGGLDEPQVHHIRPFHLHPELELEQGNLITLCEKRSHDCHFTFGHFHNWRLQNPAVVEDVARYRAESQAARGKA
jgi:5-methylcytosine-specific restriction enzyme A